MDLPKLQRIVVDALEDLKGQDIRVFNTSALTGLFDRVVIASGTSNRQTRSLGSHVRDKVKEAGGEVISVEGQETGEWVLVDAGDVVVHVMQPSIRTYYNLEEIWGGKPARVRVGPDKAKAKAKAKGKVKAKAPAKAGAGARAAAKAEAPAKPGAAAKPGAKAGRAPARRVPKTGIKAH